MTGSKTLSCPVFPVLLRFLCKCIGVSGGFDIVRRSPMVLIVFDNLRRSPTLSETSCRVGCFRVSKTLVKAWTSMELARFPFSLYRDLVIVWDFLNIFYGFIYTLIDGHD